MNQESLDFGRLYRVDEEHQKAWRAVEAAMHSVTSIVAAGAAGIDEATLSKTFLPNSNRHLRLRTTMAIGAIAGVDARRAILTPVARLFGFELAPEMVMDDREARIRAEAALRSLGPIGVRALEEAYGGRR